MHGVEFRETEPRSAEIRPDGRAGLVVRLALPGPGVAILAEFVAILDMTSGVEIAGEGEGALGVVPREVFALRVGLAQLLAVLNVLGEWQGRELGF